MSDSRHDPPWRWIEYAGYPILELDLRGCSGEEATRRQMACSRFVATLPQNSVLCLTLARGVRYDPRHVKDLATQMRENSRYIVASAVVGLEHLTKIVNVLNRLTGRSLRAFDDVEDAKDWLLKHAPGAPDTA